MDDIFAGFTAYQSKPVTRMAMRIDDESCIHVEDGEYMYKGVMFYAHVWPKAGDYICRISLDDTYHVPKAVFEERNVLPPDGFAMPQYPG